MDHRKRQLIPVVREFSQEEFWKLVEQTKFHGQMCPCEACKKVRKA